MRILKVLSAEGDAALEHACHGRAVSCATATLVECVERSQNPWSAPDVVIVDPYAARAQHLEHCLVDYVRDCQHIGLVLDGALTPQFASLAVSIASARPVSVTLRSIDKGAAVWMGIRQAVIQVARARTLLFLEPSLNRVPSPTAVAVRRAILGHSSRPTVAAIATDAGVNLRAFYRHLDKIGIGEPKDLHRASRVLGALDNLYKPGVQLAEVARRGGYREYRMFQQHVRRLLGVSPQRVRYHLDPAAIAELVARAVLPGLPTRDDLMTVWRANETARPASTERADGDNTTAA